MTALPPREPPRFDPPMPDETRKVFLDVLREQVRSQDKQFDSLRTVASILVAAGAVVLTQIVGTDVRWGHPMIAALLVLGGVASAASIGAAVAVTWPATLYRNPNPSAFLEHYAREQAKDVEEELVKQWESSYARSEPTLNRMGLRLKLSASFLGVAVLAVLAMAIVKWGVQSLPDRALEQAPIEASATGSDSMSRATVRVDSTDSQGGGTR